MATEQWSTKLELVKAEHRDRVEELERTVAELRAALQRAESEAAETADSTRSELDLTERALRDAETRAADSARFHRLGSNAFAMMIPGLERLQDAARLGGRLQGALSQPISVAGELRGVQVGLGVSPLPLQTG